MFWRTKSESTFENKDDLIIHEHEDHSNITSVVINGDEKRDDQSEESFWGVRWLM